jgi:hypothetical protein
MAFILKAARARPPAHTHKTLDPYTIPGREGNFGKLSVMPQFEFLPCGSVASVKAYSELREVLCLRERGI